MQQKPQLSFLQIWNMCFGFLGIQFGFALQNANVSRIFQTLGADMEDLPILWIAAPLTGLLVQPIIGHMSDNTWNRFGRRRPYFMVGAIFATLALFVMPNSPVLWVAAGMLWIMDASINISMEPFRAFVGDMLPKEQRTGGFAMQSFFIGVGAVVASALPYMMANWFGVENTAAPGEVPDTVKWSFYLGGAAFFGAVMWTVISTKEYPPEVLAAHDAHADTGAPEPAPITTATFRNRGIAWLVVGGAFLAWIIGADLEKQLYVLAGGFMFFGILQLVTAAMQSAGNTGGGLHTVMTDLFRMPRVMKQLAVVQFFSWFALFAMWIYGTAAVTSHHYATVDTASAVYNEGANWVGVLFAAYNGFAALAAIVIPITARALGCRWTHVINLTLGGLGLISFFFISDPKMLVVPMIGVGIAWASILSMPYALLAGVLPGNKMGIYMGIFNFFIVIPQLLAAAVLGLFLNTLFGGQSIFMLVTGGVLMILGGATTLLVDREAEP